MRAEFNLTPAPVNIMRWFLSQGPPGKTLKIAAPGLVPR